MSNPRKEPTRVRPIRLPVSLDDTYWRRAKENGLSLSAYIVMTLTQAEAERQKGESHASN